MAEENMNLSVENSEVETPDTVQTTAEVTTKKEKVADKRKPNFFVRAWKRVKKFCRDTFNEMKKVRWTPKQELIKSTTLVVVGVVAAAVALGLVDLLFNLLFDGLQRLFG